MDYNPAIQFVVKISKYCNLRCSYCYEYKELGIRGEISEQEIERFFSNVRGHISEHRPRTEFIWHGGEPLLVDVKRYRQIGDTQRHILNGCGEITNGLQTNLTVLTELHLAFLEEASFFRGLGVSFDVFGDQRVNASGELKTETVLRNMQRLIDHHICFGAITVLAKNTLPHVRRIYQFYDELGVSMRFLPVYRSAYPSQIDQHALTGPEIEQAIGALYEEWSRSETATAVEPLNECMDYAVSYLANPSERSRRYNKEFDEQVFVVNKDGAVWGVSETYDADFQYGNVFEEDFTSVLKSTGRRRSIEESQRRIESYCTDCPYFGHCPGYFVGDATKQQARQISESGCTIRNCLDFLVEKFEEQGVTEFLTTEQSAARSDEKSEAFEMQPMP